MAEDIFQAKSSEKETCKGRIYRGRVNAYVSNDTYVYQEKMVFLKRLSCKGCDSCGFLIDDLQERSFEPKRYGPIIKNIEDGELYELKVVNIQKDWETGYADDWDLEFVKIVKE